MTSSGHAYLLRSALCSMPWSRLLYGRRRRVFWGKKLLSVCGGYRPGESLWVHSNGVNGKPTFHANKPTCHDFLRFVIISEKLRPEVGNRWLWSSKMQVFLAKKDPLRANFHKCFPKPHMRTWKHIFLCKFREIWPTGSRWNRALFNGQQQKNSARAPAAASARIAPKICQGQPEQRTRSSPNFIQIRTREYVQTRHKVFAILGEASASLPSNKIYKSLKKMLVYCWTCDFQGS